MLQMIGILYKILINTMKTHRELAIEWWNNLPFNSTNTVISKHHYYRKYFVIEGKYTPAQNYSELTGREIEYIWLKEGN